MLKLKRALYFFSPAVIFCSNSMLDLRIAVDPLDAKNRSHIDVVSQASFETPYCSLLLNPEIAFYLNKSVDFGVSFGHRWQLPLGTLGHHVFFDRSQLPKISVNQVGSGFDFITPKLDFRTNYYHPISPSIQLKDRIVKPCKWIEGEMMYKSPYFNIGAGPTFNLDSAVSGVQGRLVFPFQRFSLGLGASADVSGEKHAFLITSFHFYKNQSSSASHLPMSHTKRPKIEFCPIRPQKKKFNEADKVEAEEEKEEYVEITDPEKIKEQLEKDKDKGTPYVTEEGLKTLDELEGFDESTQKYWEEKWERERKEVVAPPEVIPSPESKSIWESIRDFFLGNKNG